VDSFFLVCYLLVGLLFGIGAWINTVARPAIRRSGSVEALDVFLLFVWLIVGTVAWPLFIAVIVLSCVVYGMCAAGAVAVNTWLKTLANKRIQQTLAGKYPCE
jgi:hypothetical protein